MVGACSGSPRILLFLFTSSDLQKKGNHGRENAGSYVTITRISFVSLFSSSEREEEKEGENVRKM